MNEQQSYNRHDFLRHILEQLLPAIFSDGRKPNSRRLNLDIDDCCVPRSKASENVFAKNSIILFFEYPIRLTVLTWHLLTSDF
jgi:hypothetical protein